MGFFTIFCKGIGGLNFNPLLPTPTHFISHLFPFVNLRIQQQSQHLVRHSRERRNPESIDFLVFWIPDGSIRE